MASSQPKSAPRTPALLGKHAPERRLLLGPKRAALLFPDSHLPALCENWKEKKLTAFSPELSNIVFLSKAFYQQGTLIFFLKANQGKAQKSEEKKMTGYDQNDLTEDDNNKTINLNVGSVVTIRLSSNPTTGFTWIREGLKGTELSDEIFEIQSSFSRQPHTQQKRPGQHLIVGAGGTMVLNVKALKAGSHTLSLGYGRPWVGFDAVGRQFTLKFKVSQ